MSKHLFLVIILPIFLSCQTSGSWLSTTRPELEAIKVPQASFARGFHGTAATAKAVFLFGGMSDESPTLPPVINYGWKFDYASQQWTSLDSEHQPSPRFGHAMAANTRWLFIWGGQGSGGAIFHDGAILDQETNQWQMLPDPPIQGRRFAEAVWTGKEFLIIGGTGKGDDLEAVIGFDPASMTWRKHPDLPDGSRWGHSVITIDDMILIWGGTSSTGLKSGGWTYSPGQSSWQELARIDQPDIRSNHTAVAVGGKMLVWGGNDGKQRRNDGRLYDPVAMKWSTKIEFPGIAGRSGHSMATNQDGVLIWGGRNSQNEFLADGVFFRPEAKTWRIFAPEGLGARALHGIVAIQNRFLLIGGFGPAGNFRLHYFGDAYWLNPINHSAEQELIF